MANVEVGLRYMPHPHDGWEAYATVDGHIMTNAMTYKNPLVAMTQLAQNLAEGLEEARKYCA